MRISKYEGSVMVNGNDADERLINKRKPALAGRAG